MNYISIKRTFLMGSAALLAATLSAKAAPISVPNGSFESPDVSANVMFGITGLNQTNTQGDSTTIAGWTYNHSTGPDYQNSAGLINNPALTPQLLNAFTSIPDGNQYAYVNATTGNVITLTQANIGQNFVAGLTYTLSVYVGNTGSNGLYTLNLLDGGTAVAPEASILGNSITTDTFTKISFTYTAVDTNAIGIRLTFADKDTSDFNEQGTFDFVQLSDSVPTVPEPSTYLLLSGSLLGLVGVRRFFRSRNGTV